MIQKIFSLLLFSSFVFLNSACSVYKSQGRKSFETKAEQNISAISLKSCQGSSVTSPSLEVATTSAIQNQVVDPTTWATEENLIAVNIFGLQLYKSPSHENTSAQWLIKDLQSNSCLYQSSVASSQENELIFMKNFHQLTDLNRAPYLDQSLFY